MLEAFRAAQIQGGHCVALIGQSGQDGLDDIPAVDGLLEGFASPHQGDQPGLALGPQGGGGEIVGAEHHGDPKDGRGNPALE